MLCHGTIDIRWIVANASHVGDIRIEAEAEIHTVPWSVIVASRILQQLLHCVRTTSFVPFHMQAITSFIICQIPSWL